MKGLEKSRVVRSQPPSTSLIVRSTSSSPPSLGPRLSLLLSPLLPPPPPPLSFLCFLLLLPLLLLLLLLAMRVLSQPPFSELKSKRSGTIPSGLPADLQRLAFAGRPISSEDASLALLGVTDDSTLHCSLALLGGGKKRKKKTYTKPKKQKHKHRKVKLGVLKFFKVDDGGKVERLRQACPQCGPATFMAKHFDRVYCGKCHVTYMVEGGAAGGKGKKK